MGDFVGIAGALLGAAIFWLGRWVGRRDVRAECGLLRLREQQAWDALHRHMESAAAERRELYSRIQAYDPNVGDFTPPSIVAPPSRPGEEQQGPRSFTEEELGQLGLVEQADGMLRDTRNDALFETVEDWRFWQAELRKRRLPESTRPDEALELGWEQAVSLAKQRVAEKKKPMAAKA